MKQTNKEQLWLQNVLILGTKVWFQIEEMLNSKNNPYPG